MTFAAATGVRVTPCTAAGRSLVAVMRSSSKLVSSQSTPPGMSMVEPGRGGASRHLSQHAAEDGQQQHQPVSGDGAKDRGRRAVARAAAEDRSEERRVGK